LKKADGKHKPVEHALKKKKTISWESQKSFKSFVKGGSANESNDGDHRSGNHPKSKSKEENNIIVGHSGGERPTAGGGHLQNAAYFGKRSQKGRVKKIPIIRKELRKET